MTYFKITGLAALLALCATSEVFAEWQQAWEATSPYNLRVAAASNGVGANISNNSLNGIRFFNIHTGAEICTFQPDPQRYSSPVSLVRSAADSNLFVAYFLYRTAPNSPLSKLNVWAFRVNVPAGGAANCNPPVWTWESPFSFDYNLNPAYTGFVSRDGTMAGVMVNDPTGTQSTRTYLFDGQTGVVTDSVVDTISQVNENIAGASPNMRYLYFGGTWVRAVNPVTKTFGPKILSNAFGTLGAAMNDNGYLLETGTVSNVVKHYYTDPAYPDYHTLAVDFLAPVPPATPYCRIAALSLSGQMGAYACNDQANHIFVESFAVMRNANTHVFGHVNNATLTSASSLQFMAKQLVVLDRKGVVIGTYGDGDATANSAPEMSIMPLVGAPVPFQAPGSVVDVFASGSSLLVTYRSTHESGSGTALSNGAIIRDYSNTQ